MRVGIEKCRGCHSTELVVDYGAGDVICRACGLVDGWQLLDERPAFEDQVTNFGAVWGDAASRQKRLKVLASSSRSKQKSGDAANFLALATGSSGGNDSPRTSKRGGRSGAKRWERFAIDVVLNRHRSETPHQPGVARATAPPHGGAPRLRQLVLRVQGRRRGAHPRGTQQLLRVVESGRGPRACRHAQRRRGRRSRSCRRSCKRPSSQRKPPPQKNRPTHPSSFSHAAAAASADFLVVVVVVVVLPVASQR